MHLREHYIPHRQLLQPTYKYSSQLIPHCQLPQPTSTTTNKILQLIFNIIKPSIFLKTFGKFYRDDSLIVKMKVWEICFGNFLEALTRSSLQRNVGDMFNMNFRTVFGTVLYLLHNFFAPMFCRLFSNIMGR